MRNREAKARLVREFASDRRARRVLLVGCGSEAGRRAHIVERAALPPDARFAVACDLDHAIPLPWIYVCGDGCHLPFRDGAFDLVVSNAVIEHVGDANDQAAFVAEHQRVAAAWVITTPNRWFPVESHTNAVLLHWASGWRGRQRLFSRLLSRSEFRGILPPSAKVYGWPWSATFVATGIGADGAKG